MARPLRVVFLRLAVLTAVIGLIVGAAFARPPLQTILFVAALVAAAGYVVLRVISTTSQIKAIREAASRPRVPNAQRDRQGSIRLRVYGGTLLVSAAAFIVLGLVLQVDVLEPAFIGAGSLCGLLGAFAVGASFFVARRGREASRPGSEPPSV